MKYKVINEVSNKIIADNVSLGEAFNSIDNWCKSNNHGYYLEDMIVRSNAIIITPWNKATKIFNRFTIQIVKY